jgi:hypothetical protein
VYPAGTGAASDDDPLSDCDGGGASTSAPRCAQLPSYKVRHSYSSSDFSVNERLPPAYNTLAQDAHAMALRPNFQEVTTRTITSRQTTDMGNLPVLPAARRPALGGPHQALLWYPDAEAACGCARCCVV